VREISQLSNPERFRAWVFRFIDSAAMHWKRNLKKDCTRRAEFGTYIVETMSAATPSQSRQDMRTLLNLLAQRTRAMAGSRRRAAAFMLECYSVRQEFPSIRATAFVARVSQGAAQLYHDEALACWRRVLANVELGLPAPAAADHSKPADGRQPNP
jgi:hypothetical protein